MKNRRRRLALLRAPNREGRRENQVVVLALPRGGVPIGAILAKEPVAACFVPGDHGSTFGGNPLATATGYSVLKYVIDNDLPNEAARKGERLMKGLHSLEDRHGSIAEVRGRGLLCAVEFSSDIADQVLKQCVERGLLLNMLRANVVRFSPPLTVTDAEIDEALASFEAALKAVE